MPDHQTNARLGPVILGSTGQIGRAFRHLFDAGLWPRQARPLWHGRAVATGVDYAWDMTRAAPADPRLSRVHGMIVLAGGQGDGNTPQPETAAALTEAALVLAEQEGIAPILIASSQAVYAPTAGPHSEDGPTGGTSGYARAKQAVEDTLVGRATALRIGNVAGCDMLLSNAAQGPVRLDRFPDGQSPRRCYIGPLTLARVLLDLLDTPGPLPPALNIAAPGTVEMAALLKAAEREWTWRDAPNGALPDLRLDLTRLAGLVPLDPSAGQPETLIAEARAAGWNPVR